MIKFLQSIPSDARWGSYVVQIVVGILLFAGAVFMTLGYITPDFVEQTVANFTMLLGAGVTILGLLAAANVNR